MNISMGFMLIFIAVIQMTMFTGSTVRVIVGSVLLCLGAFNLFAGLRNHASFQRLLAERGVKARVLDKAARFIVSDTALKEFSK